MAMEEKAACFTGHRPRECGIRFLPQEARTQRLLVFFDQAVECLCRDMKVDTFYCGMADGFDLFAARRLVQLRQEGRIPAEVGFVAVLPYAGQTERFKETRWKNEHEQLLHLARARICLHNEYCASCYRERNDYMVEHAQVVLAFWNHARRSGTGMTVRMAQQKERVLLNLFDCLDEF